MQSFSASKFIRLLSFILMTAQAVPGLAALKDDSLAFTVDTSVYVPPDNTSNEGFASSIAVGQEGWDGTSTWLLGNALISLDGDELKFTIYPSNEGPFNYMFITSATTTFASVTALGSPVPASILANGARNPGLYPFLTGPGIFIDMTNLTVGNYTLQISTVPEPAKTAMLLAGLAVIGFATARQRRRSTQRVTATFY